jgi:hypothetical protein
MANHDVEAFGNLVQSNQTVAVAVISYFLTGGSMPETYYPFPRTIHVHDNSLASNGTSPDASTDLGELLYGIQQGIFGGSPLPDVIWDGIAAPDGVPGENPNEICIGNELSWLSLGTGMTESGISFSPSTVAGPYRCELPPVDGVTAW